MEKKVSWKISFRFTKTHQFSFSHFGQLTLKHTVHPTTGMIEFILRDSASILFQGESEFPNPAWFNKIMQKMDELDQKEKENETNIDGSSNYEYKSQPDSRESSPINSQPNKSSSFHPASWFGLALALFKGGKALKVALAAASFSGWSLLYSPLFAAMLITVLVFHEYGHLQAMKKFNIPTKGMYLIPFFGGVAVGGKTKYQWQDVYIAMMGPVYGLAMTAFFYVFYLASEIEFFAKLASLSALINLFNLLPLYPLDGGRVVKAMVFSGQKYWGLVFLLVCSAAGFIFFIEIGAQLLCFFLILGVIDICTSWSNFKRENLFALTRYGIAYSLVWYLIVFGTFLGLIYLIEHTGVPGTDIATRILAD